MNAPTTKLLAQLLRNAGRMARGKGVMAPMTKLVKQALDLQASFQPRPQPVPQPRPQPRPQPGWPHTAPPPQARPAHSDAAKPTQGSVHTGTHAAATGAREYRLFVPAHAGSAPMPLVVMLHGCTQTPADFAAGTRMDEAAQTQGFAVLYPAQSRSANPQACWQWFKHSHQQRGRGEPAILAGMVEAIVAERGFDASRVFVAGLSAGGAMAAILGQTHPDLFAAVGVHSGLPAGAAQDLPSALAAMQSGALVQSAATKTPPTIVFHGDADTTVHPRNGSLLAARSGAAESVAMAAGQAGGTARRSATCSVQRDANGHVLTEHWQVHGAGHAWAGGSADGSYTDPQGPDATAEMLRFFFSQTPR